MKTKLAGAVIAVVLSGCANQVGPIQVSQVFALGPPAGEDTSCAVTEDENIKTIAAKLDVAAGDPQVTLGFVLSGPGYSTPGLVLRTGEVLEPANQNVPNVSSVVINYRLSKRLGATPRAFTQNIFVPFTSSGDKIASTVTVPLISQEFGQQLFDGLQPSAALDDFVDISVDIEFRGEIDSSKTPFTTGIVTFPIRAARSNPMACPAGQRFKRYSKFDNNMNPDLCNYSGVSYNLSSFAPPPNPATDCCDPATGGPSC